MIELLYLVELGGEGNVLHCCFLLLFHNLGVRLSCVRICLVYSCVSL